MKIVQYLILFFSLSACSSALDTTSFLTIKMLGNLEAPADAEGTNDPRWQGYTLEGVYLIPETGDALSLYSDAPHEYKIINRSQIIYKKEVDSDWLDVNFSALTVQFDQTVTGGGKYSDSHELTLETGSISYSTPFTFKKGQGLTAVINVNWKNTMTRNEEVDPPTESMALPEFDVSVSLE